MQIAQPLTRADVMTAMSKAETPAYMRAAVETYLLGRNPEGKPHTTFTAAVTADVGESELQSALYAVKEITDQMWIDAGRPMIEMDAR